MSPFSSLRARFLIVLVVAMVPSVAIVWRAGRDHRRLLVGQVESSAHDLARIVAERNQRAVDRARGLLVGLSRLPSVRRLDGAACSAEIAPVLAEPPRYTNVGAVGLDGTLFCSAVPLAAPVNLADRAHVRGALDRGRFTVGGYVRSRSTGAPTFAFANPVRDADGRVVAAAVATLDLGKLQHDLDALPMPDGAEVEVIDRDGLVLAARPWPAGRVGLPLERRLRDPALAHAGAVEGKGIDGVRRVYGFHEVLGSRGEPAMWVVAGVPAEAAYAPVNRIERNSIFALVAVVLVALAIAALGGDVLVVRKLRALAAAARRIAAGDYGARTGLPPGREEIGELARAFDDMAGSLDRLSRQNQLVLDAVGEGIVGIDAQARILFANPAAARALGWTPEEMLGRDGHALFHARRPDGTELPRDECPILAATRDGQARHAAGEVFWRRDGSSFPVEYVSTPLVDAGRDVGVVLVFRDVSERLRLEERLRQAEKMEAIGQLAGGIAHDFNNLLTAIVSYAHLVRDGLPSGHPSQPDVREIEIAAGRAAALTRQLLAFSRRQQLAPKVFELRTVLRGMETMLRRVLPETVALHVDTPVAGTVLADPAQIEMAVLNLAVNARDAMPTGGRIDVRLEELDEAPADERDLPPGPLVVLSVKDEGVGMDPATRDRIFEPFFTTKPTGSGTGLGLSTVFGVVSQSGGAIRVRSAVGTGSEFRIYLPRRDPSAAGSAAIPPPPPRRGSETVLLVEDDAAIRLVARRSLAAAGYHVLDAASAGDALQIALAQPRVDLLVTDVILPGKNGWELSVELTRVSSALRVLFVSGYAAEHGGASLLPEGIPFLGKPFAPEDLLAAARRSLEGAPWRDQLAEREEKRSA